MRSAEEIRFELHKRLLALDASNVELMKLVVLDMVSGSDWDEAVAELRLNVADLESILTRQGLSPKKDVSDRPTLDPLSGGQS